MNAPHLMQIKVMERIAHSAKKALLIASLDRTWNSNHSEGVLKIELKLGRQLLQAMYVRN